jgi:hypothetical protein
VSMELSIPKNGKPMLSIFEILDPSRVQHLEK